jgi:hypothetical protein
MQSAIPQSGKSAHGPPKGRNSHSLSSSIRQA